MAAALSSEHFDNLQLRLKAPSKDAVRDICVESHRATNRRLEDDGGDNERFHCSGCLATPLPPAPLSPCSHGFCRADPPSVPRLLPLQPEESHHQDPAGEQAVTRSLVSLMLFSPTWRTEALRDQNGGPMSVGGHRAGFHGDGGADPGRIRDQLSVVAAK
ncbi:COMM domain-containing protein 9-like isoform X1 [Gasterosteus aculeatus]